MAREIELLAPPLAAQLDKRHQRVLSVDCSAPSRLLLVYSRRTVGTGGPGARRTTPDALVCTMPVPMLFCRRIRACRSIRRGTAPFAVLLVVNMLMFLGRTMGV